MAATAILLRGSGSSSLRCPHSAASIHRIRRPHSWLSSNPACSGTTRPTSLIHDPPRSISLAMALFFDQSIPRSFRYPNPSLDRWRVPSRRILPQVHGSRASCPVSSPKRSFSHLDALRVPDLPNHPHEIIRTVHELHPSWHYLSCTLGKECYRWRCSTRLRDVVLPSGTWF